MNDKGNKMDELLTAAQRQLALRDELLRRQGALVHEVSVADVGAPRRADAVLRAVLTLLLLVIPSALVAACTQAPDGRDMRTEGRPADILADANQVIMAI